MNDAEVEKLVELLSKFKPGFLPYPVFEQVARIVALPIVEFVPLRLKDGKVEVLLIPRDNNDPHWSGMVHTPGTVIRATDLNSEEGNYPAFKRIIHDELKDTSIGPPHYVGSILHESKRGVEQAQLYWVEVLGEPNIGVFYSVDALPDNLIKSQENFIKEASRNFIESHKVSS